MIYIKEFYEKTVSYLTVSIDDTPNTTKNETAFTEINKVFKEYF